MSRLLYVDCFSGASGDMFLGALIDLGVPLDVISAEVDKLGIEGAALRVEAGSRHGIAGTRVHVDLRGEEILEGEGLRAAEAAGRTGLKLHAHDPRGHGPGEGHAHDHGHAHHDHPHAHVHPHHGHHGHSHGPGDEAAHGPTRRYVDIDRHLAEAGLLPRTEALARRAFRQLGEAESEVHGMALDTVELHEVGAVDALVDVVGTCAAIAHLGMDEIVVSRIPLGRGMTRGSHGAIPLPAPATLLVLRDAPVYGLDEEGETVTPTGATLLRAIADRFGPLPAMRVDKVGYGVGARDSRQRPNLLRLLQGETLSGNAVERLWVLEANLDDMNPEFFEHVTAALFEGGALDVWLSPLQMKKGRPATLLSVLCDGGHRDALAQLVLRESTSLGVRYHEVERRSLHRSVREVETPWGLVRVKLGEDGGRVLNVAPEYEDCRRVARAAGVPLKQVYHAALRALAPGFGPEELR